VYLSILKDYKCRISFAMKLKKSEKGAFLDEMSIGIISYFNKKNA